MFKCICAHACWDYKLSLAAAWTWGHRAVAALSLSGYQIWPDFPISIDIFVYISYAYIYIYDAHIIYIGVFHTASI